MAVAATVEEVRTLLARLEDIYNQSRITYLHHKETHDKIDHAGTREHLKTMMVNHSAVATSIKNGITDLKVRIDLAEKTEMPVNLINVRDNTDPLYAYEASETDSNFLLTRRARSILKGIVDIKGGEAQPNRTTLLFGPVGHPIELFGWEIVGLYNMLVKGPVSLATSHPRKTAQMIEHWGADDDSFKRAVSDFMEQLLPNDEDRDSPLYKRKRDTFAHPEWIDFRKNVYNPILGKKETKFHKRILHVIDQLQKKNTYVRMDLPCELSPALLKDVDTWYRACGYEKVVPQSNKIKIGWGIRTGDIASKQRIGLSNIMKFYLKTDGECALTDAQIQRIRQDTQLHELLKDEHEKIHMFVQTHLAEDVPLCALLSLCKHGFFQQSLKNEH